MSQILVNFRLQIIMYYCQMAAEVIISIEMIDTINKVCLMME